MTTSQQDLAVTNEQLIALETTHAELSALHQRAETASILILTRRSENFGDTEASSDTGKTLRDSISTAQDSLNKALAHLATAAKTCMDQITALQPDPADFREWMQKRKTGVSPLTAMRSAAGWYVGSYHRDEEGFLEPNDRNSVYFPTRSEALEELKAICS